MNIGNLKGNQQFLTFGGILPVTFPNGTKIVVLPDIHCPAHNAMLMWAILAFLKDYQPDVIIFIGDVADVFALSAWPNPPRSVKNIQSELDETRRLVDKIISVSKCKQAFYIMGNHEDRVFRYLKNVAPGAATILDYNTREPILSFHGLMGYKIGDKVTFIYDLAEQGGFGGGLRVNDDMTFHHGFIVRPNPGASPRADSARFGQSTTTGHTHRLGCSATTTANETIRAFELGHLVNPNHAYLAYANMLNNWHPGFGVGQIVGGKVHLEAVPVRNVNLDGNDKLVFTFGGKIYQSADR